jgi:NADH-quinone oxidoreductase subunit B
MIKELVRPADNFNLMVSKVGDALVKAFDKPLGYAINWGRVWLLWPVHLETACCSVEYGAVEGPSYDIERFGVLEIVQDIKDIPNGLLIAQVRDTNGNVVGLRQQT